jgi:trehalose synthase
MTSQSQVDLEHYRQYVGDEAVDRITAKADALRGQRVVHMNSTFHGGGVVEILLSLVGMMNRLGIDTEWRLLRGTPEFYAVTREMHDAIQGGEIDLTDEKKRIFEQTFADNAVQNKLDHDAVYMHDHHTIGMVAHYHKKGPWIWRCHLDLSRPDPRLIEYLEAFGSQFSAGIYILEEYQQDFGIPNYAFLPAIDPTKVKSQTLDDDAVRDKLEANSIPMDLPIVTQISRFDRWKDPNGVVDAFEIARRDIDATLVLLGNRPADDPEENEVFDRLMTRRSDRVLVLDGSDEVLVSALQQHAAVVLQKSLREGFGLTVSEALWKGTPVIGGNVGGIPRQIDDGVNGFLVNSVEEAAERIVEVISDPDRAAEMGARGREKVRENFLMSRLLEQHLDLLGSFEPTFTPAL